MGILFPLDDEFPSKENMEVFNNPSKRIRLDLPNNFDGNLPNDDLWGAEDLTAEEFDMLEVQATQPLKQEDTSRTFLQPKAPVASNNASLAKVSESRQQLYELEGKVKLLTQSFEKANNQLIEEKLNRDKIVNEKMRQSLAKENDLRKEIKKVESSLQFKNQEMKSLYEKVQLLVTQLQVKKEKSNIPTPQTSNSFLEKFKFDASTSVQKSELSPGNKPKSRKYKLLVDTPRGKVQGTDIISTLLCNRLSMNPVQNYSSAITQTHQSLESTANPSSRLSALSILRLGSDQQTEELFDYFSCVFRNYLKSLKSPKNVTVGSNANSPLSLRRKEARHDRAIVISCLKDLTYIISSSQFLSMIQKYGGGDGSLNQMTDVPSTSTANFFPVYKQRTNEPVQQIHSLLQSLVSLANPDSYPVNYLKNKEVELSLASLVSWSTLAPESFLHLTDEIPYHSIMCCYEDPASLLLSLKLLTNLCIHKDFIPVLLHKDDSCLLCTISSLTVQKISQNPLKYTPILLLIEDLLSALFTIHSFQELKLDSSPCSTLILQAIVISLLKFYETYQESSHDIILVLRKGFALIELLSRYLPNFKERRSSCEDSYISLVCGMLTLSKENPAFKEFYDRVHDLWNFQEDTSEFDLDDAFSEDSSQMVETTSQSGL